MKIITIIGARPQIIKAAALSRAISEHFKGEIKEVIVHTGQHYDENMSGVFFGELGIPKPDYNLAIGSSNHAAQTAGMLKGIEEIIRKEKPDALVVYGDTNSTVAGGLAASKIGIPLVHIEAGLRSYDKTMPEEINRILTDHISTLLFSPTTTGKENLTKENIITSKNKRATINAPKVFVSGDIMYDNSLFFSKIAQSKEKELRALIGNEHPFSLATVHRASNTDDYKRLRDIFKAFIELINENDTQIVLPLHPRTKNAIQHLDKELQKKIFNTKGLVIIEPVSFLSMTWLESHAEMILTDSGGVQKEAFFFEKPCIILRKQTEWVEIVKSECGILTHTNIDDIKKAYLHFSNNKALKFPSFYGDGEAAKNICQIMLEEIT